MIFLDTSYLIGVINPKDDLYSFCQQWSTVEERFVTTHYVIVEFVNSLPRSIFRQRVHELVSWLRFDENVHLVAASDAWMEAGLSLHSDRPDKKWSLTDCISFEVMRTVGCTRALTHDHHFEQAGFEALLRHDP